MATALQIVALLALIYDGIVALLVVGTLIKWAVEDWRE